MDAIYTINWAALIESLMPLLNRDQLTLKWLNALIQPLVTLYLDFLNFRRSSLYKVSHNSQVVYLQKMLNDKFDDSLRRIRINNAVIKEPVWFYEPEDDKPVWFYEPEDNKPVIFYEDSDFNGDGVDFTVLVPSSLRPATATAEQAYITRMSGQINYYKLLSKNYTIVWID